MAISGSTFTEMVNKQRSKNIRKGLGPEITAVSVDQFEDIFYMADLCASELRSIVDGIYERSLTEVGFKCDPEEYHQRLIECKRQADWLVNNLELWS